MEVAREYPTAQVVGTDLSPMQSTNTPENCKFLVESLMDGLSFETGSVDYLQSRYVLLEMLIFRSLLGGVPLSAWPGYIAEIFRVLKPGTGWAVLLELDLNWRSDDGSLPEDSYVRKVFH
jgi:ubiquinone/menaquinone biosynthesis C-methylase UbiE